MPELTIASAWARIVFSSNPMTPAWYGFQLDQPIGLRPRPGAVSADQSRGRVVESI
jgi:hypothetical protein